MSTFSIGSGPQGSWACNCVGPQPGQPLCPCRMRNVREVDGRWVETIDHGPVNKVVFDKAILAQFKVNPPSLA